MSPPFLRTVIEYLCKCIFGCNDPVNRTIWNSCPFIFAVLDATHYPVELLPEYIETGDLPVHVKEELRRLNDKEEKDRKQKEIDKSTCKV